MVITKENINPDKKLTPGMIKKIKEDKLKSIEDEKLIKK